MDKIIEPRKFLNQVEELYQQAREETIVLLKNSQSGTFIAIPNWEDEVDTVSSNDVPIGIWAVGLNDDNHLCIKAIVLDVGYGHDEEDYPAGWVDITTDDIQMSSYPDLYRFVAEHIAIATTKEEADKVEWD